MLVLSVRLLHGFFSRKIVLVWDSLCLTRISRYYGRRTIFVAGLAFLAIGQLLIGALSVVADHGNDGARWAQAGKQFHAFFMCWAADTRHQV